MMPQYEWSEHRRARVRTPRAENREKGERERADPGERSTGQTITLVSWHGYCAEPGGGVGEEVGGGKVLVRTARG